MKKTTRIVLLFLLLISFLPFLFSCTESQINPNPDIETTDEKTEYKYICIIGVDGGGNFFNQAYTPKMDKIFENKATTYSAQCEIPSSSTQNWTSILFGVESSVHGCPAIVDSTFTYPSICRLIRETDPNADICSFSCWGPINDFIECDIGLLCYSGKNDKNSDRIITEKAEKMISVFCPKFLFIQFNGIDGDGHNYGYGSKEHLDYFTVIDEYIDRIYQAYDGIGVIDETLFIVVSDHGGTKELDENGATIGNHGGETPEETTVFIGVAGKSVANIDLGEIRNRDVAAIAAAALNIEIPDVWTAKVPEGLFNDR